MAWQLFVLCCTTLPLLNFSTQSLAPSPIPASPQAPEITVPSRGWPEDRGNGHLGVVELDSDWGYMWVPSEVTPVTLWIPRVIMDETLIDSFKKWMCPGENQEDCIKNMTTDSTSQQSRRRREDNGPLPAEEPKRRQKRFLGLLFAGLIGGAFGVMDAELVRYQLNNRIDGVIDAMKDLTTGVQHLGDQLLYHLRVDEKWKRDLVGSLHGKFSEQAKFNADIVTAVANLTHQINDALVHLSESVHQVDQNVKVLARLTAAGLTKLAYELTHADQLLNAMIWDNLKEGKIPEWALSLSSFQLGFDQLIKEIKKQDPGMHDVAAEYFLLKSSWATLAISNEGILLGNMIPHSDHIWRWIKITVPPACYEADDSTYYTGVFTTSYYLIQHEDQRFYRDNSYWSTCSSSGDVKTCDHPATAAIGPDVFDCANSLFNRLPPKNCHMIITPCPNNYMIQRVRTGLWVTGAVTWETDDKIVSSEPGLGIVIPYTVGSTIRIKTMDGSTVTTIYRSIAQNVEAPYRVPLVGSWKLNEVTQEHQLVGGSSVIRLPSDLTLPEVNSGLEIKRTEETLQRLASLQVKLDGLLSRHVDVVLIIIICIIILLILAVIILSCMVWALRKKKTRVYHAVKADDGTTI